MFSQDADENLAIDNELLCEIEAESWVNGTRGILVESRAPPLPNLEQDCSLLPEIIDDHPNKASRAAAAAALEKEGGEQLYRMPWQKLQVRVVFEADVALVLGHRDIGGLNEPSSHDAYSHAHAHTHIVEIF